MNTTSAKGKAKATEKPRPANSPTWTRERPHIVLVLQGGGALGAYQAGIYQALHESGIEPDWIIGTSIGAINGALIAGNKPENRLKALQRFWQRVTHMPLPTWSASKILHPLIDNHPFWNVWSQWQHNSHVVMHGIAHFFRPNPWGFFNPRLPLGIEQASYYSTQPLRDTLNELVDFQQLGDGEGGPTRLTVGAVNARTGAMRYFDSRQETLGAMHVMASGALAPAFGAVRIDGDPYWDGGLYSNTPIEVVLDDRPRRHSLIFSAYMWKPHGPEPASIWDVEGRLKDIQYASRSSSHVERQRQLHRLRHVINALSAHMPEALRSDPAVRELDAWGCSTVMDIVQLNAAPLPGQDQTKDIDFTSKGIEQRHQAGYEDAMQAIRTQPWKQHRHDPLEGIFVHEVNA